MVMPQRPPGHTTDDLRERLHEAHVPDIYGARSLRVSGVDWPREKWITFFMTIRRPYATMGLQHE
jgi:hypothetical protein